MTTESITKRQQHQQETKHASGITFDAIIMTGHYVSIYGIGCCMCRRFNRRWGLPCSNVAPMSKISKRTASVFPNAFQLLVYHSSLSTLPSRRKHIEWLQRTILSKLSGKIFFTFFFFCFDKSNFKKGRICTSSLTLKIQRAVWAQVPSSTLDSAWQLQCQMKTVGRTPHGENVYPRKNWFISCHTIWFQFQEGGRL